MKDKELFTCPRCKGIKFNLMYIERGEESEFEGEWLRVTCTECDSTFFEIEVAQELFSHIEKAYLEEELEKIEKD